MMNCYAIFKQLSNHNRPFFFPQQAVEWRGGKGGKKNGRKKAASRGGFLILKSEKLLAHFGAYLD